MRLRVGFCSSNTWISRVIERFTAGRAKVKVSHAFVFCDGGEVGNVIEAAWCGFRINTTDKIGASIVKVLDTKVPLRLDLAKQWIGTPYAYEGMIGMVLVCIGRLFRRVWRNPFPNPHHMFCSEAVVYLMQSSGEPGSDALDPPAVDPEALMEWMEARQ